MAAMAASDTIEAEGHLIDSGLLSAIFDKIIEAKASYEIVTFDIGRTNEAPSRIKMRINTADTAVLDELLQHLVLWLGFVGAALATHEQRHLSIDVLTRLLPARWQPWRALVVDLAACLVCALMARAAWTFVRSEAAAGTVLTFGVPAWLAQSIIPLGFCVIALRSALHVLETLLQMRQRKTGV